MNPIVLTLLIILAVSVLILIALYFFGRKMQKRQAEQQAQMEATKQTFNILVIDKKKMRLKDAGLPSAVLEQTPKMMRRAKLPIVKAKIGPQIMSLVCDASVFELIPVKKEVKATISGIYISEVKALRGQSLVKPTKKKSRYKRFVEKMQEKAGAKPIK